MKFLLLGPFSVVNGDRPAPVGRGNERALIALLALHANTVVSTDRIVDAMWGDRPPATARDMVRLYVNRARSRVGDRLVTDANGYLLRTENGEVDVAELERLRQAGAQAVAEGDAAGGAACLAEAVGLVRGEPLAEFREFPFARDEIPRLEELRLGTTEEYYDARLAAGEAAELVPALEQLVEENPYRERLRGQLMLALYRAGRQTDALGRYQEGRRLLADEIGIEPSPRLRELERAILQHDPALMPERAEIKKAVQEAAAPPRRRRGRRMAALLALVVLGAGIAALVFTQTGGRAGLTSLPRNSVGVIDPVTNRLGSPIRLVGDPVDMTESEGRIWVAIGEPQSVGEIDPNRHTLVKPIPLHSTPRRIGPGTGGVWIADSFDGSISRVDAKSRVQGRARWPFGHKLVGIRISFGESPEGLWLAGDTVDEAAKVDPRTGEVGSLVRGPNSPVAIAVGFGALWLASGDRSVIERVSGKATHGIPIGAKPVAITTGGGFVWAVSQSRGALYRIDPGERAVTRVSPVGPATSVAYGDGSVWVGTKGAGTIKRVDPRTRKVETIRIGRPVAALSYYDGRLWVAAA